MDTQEFAKTCFDRIQEDAPADVPLWDDLHKGERVQLAKFVDSVLDELIIREWHVWQIEYQIPPLRSISITAVFAATAKDAEEVFLAEKPAAQVRSICLRQIASELDAPCDHPWHRNSGLTIPCPECGAGSDDDESEVQQ